MVADAGHLVLIEKLGLLASIPAILLSLALTFYGIVRLNEILFGKGKFIERWHKVMGGSEIEGIFDKKPGQGGDVGGLGEELKK